MIIGMTKSCLNYNGANAQKVELDFLRLLYAVTQNSEISKGYLLLAQQEMLERARGWKKKYRGSSEKIIITCPDISDDEIQLLLEEKDKNRDGNKYDSEKESARATKGKAIMESKLKDIIEANENCKPYSGEMPFGIKWDYIGVTG